MSDTLHPPPSFPTKHTQSPRRRVSGTSYKSWVSSLATLTPLPAAHSSPAPPLPGGLDLASPDTSARTIKLSHLPRAADGDAASSSTHSESSSAADKPADDKPGDSKPDDGGKYDFGLGLAGGLEWGLGEHKMSTVEEVSEQATTPGGLPRYGKARSLVGGLVSSLRSLPRAVTHGSVYDRRSASTRGSSCVTSANFEHDGALAYKYAGGGVQVPFPVPFIFAPPYAQGAHEFVASPASMSGAGLSKRGSYADGEGYAEHEGDDEERRHGRGLLTGLLSELTSMPWVSQRISVDYIPGVSRAHSAPDKTPSSWYTIPPPATPSDISHVGRLVPEPWFPPAHVPSAIAEADEDAAAAAAEEGAQETPEERAEKLAEELRVKTEELSSLRQVVEHQKNHIGQLEMELERVRKEAEENLHRRKSSVRQSLRARESLRASMRRTSVRVSRPVSSFYD